MSEMDEAVRQMARPKADFAEFERKTGRLWTWWARRLVRRGVPPWLDADDVRQEILIEAWRSAGRWKGAGGAKPTTWVAQSAIYVGRKAVMRARGVNRHAWRFDDPPCFDIGVDDVECMAEPIDAEQEMELLAGAIVREVAREHGLQAALVVQAVAACDGDLTMAATMVYDDRDARLLLRLGSFEAAKRAVRVTVEQISTKGRTHGIDGRSDPGHSEGRQEAHVRAGKEAWRGSDGRTRDGECHRADFHRSSGE